MDLISIVSKVSGGRHKKSGEGYIMPCPCPHHEDKKPSFTMGENNGKLLWRCHAGCSQDETRDALRAIGVLEAAQKPRNDPWINVQSRKTIF